MVVVVTSTDVLSITGSTTFLGGAVTVTCGDSKTSVLAPVQATNSSVGSNVNHFMSDLTLYFTKPFHYTDLHCDWSIYR